MVSFARFILGVGGTALAVAASHPAWATTYTYQMISVPQSYATWVTGLADDGTIIGYYWDINYRTHGFLLKNNVFTNIDGPDLAATYPKGLNNKGDVVGELGEGSIVAGFILHNGKLRTLHFQKAAGTELEAINDAGVLAGNRLDTAGRAHPFVYENHLFTRIPIDAPGPEFLALDAKADLVGNMKRHGVATAYSFKTGKVRPIRIPGAATSGANAISPDGKIAGFYATAGSPVTHGFTTNDHTVATIDYPGATTTNLFAINNAGTVAGYGADAKFENVKVFSYQSGVFSSLVPPGAFGFLAPVAINAGGQILVEVTEGTKMSAFLATPQH